MAEGSAGSVTVDVRGNIAPFEAALAKARQMAELFDAQVSQKLGGNPATEAGLAKIAAAVEQTNAILTKMAGAAGTSDAALVKLTGDASKASVAISEVKTSTTAATASVGKLATEVNTASASLQRAVSANQSFAASNLRMSESFGGGAARAEDIQAYGAALDDIRAKYNPLFRVTREYLTVKEEIRIANKLGAISEGEASDALSRERQSTLASIAVLKGHTVALNGHGTAARLGTAQTMALTHAVRSFAEQVALGISPLQALVGQMNHLSFVASGPGGPSAAISAIGSSVASAASKLSQLVAGSTILRTLGVAAIGASLGFDAIRDAASEAEHRAVGFGETFSAIFQTIGNDIRSNFGAAIDAAISPVTYAFQKLGSAAVDIAELVINSFHAAFYDIGALWNTLPDIFGLLFTKAANNGISALDSLVKKASDAVDKISSALNNIPGVNIPLLNAPDQSIKLLDEQKYIDNVRKAVADRNAEVERIMKETPLRTFASDVVDQIQTNHALEGLDALKSISFDSATSSANGFSSAVGGIGKAANGVTVEFGGMSQQVINVSRAFQDAKLSQLGELQQTTTNLHATEAKIKEFQSYLDASSHASIDAVFGKGFSGNANAATDAIDRTVNSIHTLFAAYDTGNGTVKTLNDSMDLLRQALLAQGGDPVAINAFFDSIVNGEIKVRQLRSTVQGLHGDILAIPNRTVTITVKTQQVGSGTQSLYTVPSSNGGTSSVGVTRYGAAPGSQSGPSITANTVQRSGGYGSMGGTGSPGSTTVNVTRFGAAPARAAGGPVAANSPYWVGEHGPELVVPSSAGSVIPNAQSTALANPQSAFTGQVATRDTDRMWTVQMNIEANTRKTSQVLDEIKASGGSSGISSGSSYSGGSSSGPSVSQDAADNSAYQTILAGIKANFHAAGIVGAGIMGYGLQGLNASPEQIANNIVNGGQSPLSFATGGVMGGDTEHVEFFKNPNEKVIIARPDQFEDRRQGAANANSSGGSGDRPIQFSQTNRWDGNAPPSKESLASVRRATELGIRDALRSVNGR